MNMISTGGFLKEMNASGKQSELVKKLVGAWEQKNAKVARAGGVSLMALSLAACGSDDDTPFSQVDVDAGKAAATTAALTGADGTVHASVDAAVTSNDTAIESAATTAALTGADGTVHASVDAAITSNDTAIAAAVDTSADDAAAINAAVAADTSFTTLAELVAGYNNLNNPTAASLTATSATQNLSTSMTTSNDSVTAANGTVGAGDVIADPSATDSDTMTIAHTGATLASTGVISNVENITVNAASTTTFTITDASGVTGGAMTINLTTPGGATAATVSDIGSDTSVIAGSRVATLTVDTGGDRTDLNVTGGTGATTVNGSANKLTTATVDGSAGTNVDLEFGANSSAITLTGGSGTVDVNNGAGVKTTGLTVSAAAASTVTMDVGANSSNINVTTGKGAVDINNGTNVKVTGLVVDASAILASAAIDIDVGDGSDLTLTAGTTAGAITLDSASVSETTDTGSTVTVTADAADIAAGITDFDTVNLTLNGTASTVTLDDEVAAFTASATAAKQTITMTAIDNLGTAGGTLSGAFAITMTATTNNMDDEVFASDGAATHVLNLSTAQTADVNLSNVDTDIRIELGTAMNAVAGGVRFFELANGQTIGAEAAQTNNISLKGSTAISGVTLDLTDAANTGDFIFTNVGTVTVTAEANNTTATTVTVDSDAAGTQGAMALSGSKNISLHADSDASAVTSSGFTGNLTATMSATMKSITSGSGDDSITMYNGAMTLDAGAGDDTLVSTAIDLSDDTVSISGVEVVSQTTVATTFKVGQLSGTETVTGTTGDLTITGTAAAADTIDLSGFTNGLTQGTNASGGFLKATGLAGADTITGSGSNDVLNGGAGADTITAGNGTDYVTGGAGGDTITLTEATANSAADYVIIAAVTDGSADGVAGAAFTGYDTVTGFLAGTDKVIGDTANAYTTVTVGTALFSAGALTVAASTAATLAASDLTGTTALDVDSVVAYVADINGQGNVLGGGAGYANGEKEVLGVTDATGDQTFLYALESADGTFTADEINLIAVIDDVIATADIIIA